MCPRLTRQTTVKEVLSRLEGCCHMLEGPARPYSTTPATPIEPKEPFQLSHFFFSLPKIPYDVDGPWIKPPCVYAVLSETPMWLGCETGRVPLDQPSQRYSSPWLQHFFQPLKCLAEAVLHVLFLVNKKRTSLLLVRDKDLRFWANTPSPISQCYPAVGVSASWTFGHSYQREDLLYMLQSLQEHVTCEWR
ncbi:hypothetical protein BCR34DRAFT_559182 [Clohesyomyces aquaticus]|uniref:Uncharacterized protein n=1 Tax=Clohesyomyces aquaticus TaxID=1231657 RepID=A0A1Y1ZY23_9PLEO|nr:hypothetical protein BCR34DRAFT_559182 [Clohesyomyces aquaticus]